MIRPNTLKLKIESGQPVFGLFVSIPHPVIVEMIGHAEYDFVIIDHEHAAIGMEQIEELVRAAELLGMTPLVRVSGIHRTEILKVLDCGAQGIVIPHVQQREQLEEAARHAYYHPIGRRSLNSGRAGTFAKYALTDYIREANEAVMLVPMVESIEGIRNREGILTHPQVSFVLEGAADLSQSLGVPWQTHHPEVLDHLEQLRLTAHQCGIPYAAVARSKEDMPALAEQGVRMFVLGDDRNTAFRAYGQKLSDYRDMGGWI